MYIRARSAVPVQFYLLRKGVTLEYKRRDGTSLRIVPLGNDRYEFVETFPNSSRIFSRWGYSFRGVCDRVRAFGGRPSAYKVVNDAISR